MAHMGHDIKKQWRSYWVDIVRGEDIKECNFISLPGPEMLDFKELSKYVKVRNSVFVEREQKSVDTILSNISRKKATQVLLSLKHNRLVNAFDYHTMSKVSLCHGKFEELTNEYSYETYKIIKNKAKECPVVMDLDFCGSCGDKQVDSVANLLKILKTVPILLNQKVVVVTNFMPSYMAKVDKITKVKDIDSKNLSPSRCTARWGDIFNKVAYRVGRLAERLSNELIKLADVIPLSVYDPVHYNNYAGPTNVRYGYTTNVFSYFNN